VPTLTFLGAAQTVTGSKYLVETDSHRVLVDCGLFQGLRELRRRNWDDLPVDPRSITAVVLTHAHLDHTGLLPRLVAHGFQGRIFCTPGTADLTRLVLPDAGRLQEEDARQANKHRYTRYDVAEPLFTEADAFRAITMLQPVGFDRPMTVAPGIEISYRNAGHLLGSAYVRMTFPGGGSSILFGGDIGRYGRPVLPDPTPVETAADILLLESTYGDRDHEPDDDGERLAAIIRETVKLGGKVVIPAFAIGRVEEVLYWLQRLERQRRIPVVPVFVDSPMAVDALKFYRARTMELDPDTRPKDRDVLAFATQRFQTVNSTQQSKDLTASRASAIVISASGMATGGRVLHHMKAALRDPKHTILFVGYQAEGTRGRALVEGATTVKMHGELVPVNARIEKVDSMSAHADRSELVRWLKTFPAPPTTTYLVHGEPGPMATFKEKIAAELGWHVEVPGYKQSVTV
jgi:metallo-beta-lactamase family protein